MWYNTREGLPIGRSKFTIILTEIVYDINEQDLYGWRIKCQHG